MENSILNYLDGTCSIMMHGSAARNEATIYSNNEQDVLLGNLGFTVITKSPIKDRLKGLLLRRFLAHIENSSLVNLIDRPLVLIKPFEVSVIPYDLVSSERIAPDIWVFEMVKSGKILFGKDLTAKFPLTLAKEHGYKMIINRLFGLNLCFPVLAQGGFDDKITRLTINYECVKGVLAALESLLIITNDYRPSYSQRGQLSGEVVEKYSSFFENPSKATAEFRLATTLKLNPSALDTISPLDYWFTSRSLLETCLKIYASQNINAARVFSKKISYSQAMAIRSHKLMEFLLNNRFDFRALTSRDPDQISRQLMFSCVFSLEQHGKLEGVEKLIKLSEFANLLHTKGEWVRITDYTKRIAPRGP